jgi:phosphoglycolate phosphatase
MFHTKKLLLFDLDGTLIDSVPDLATAVNSMLVSLKYKTFDEETIRGWVGNGAQKLVERAILAANTAIDSVGGYYLDNALKLFLSAYEKNLSCHSKPYPNVKKTLQTLQKRGYTLAIITNKPHRFVEPLLRELKLYEHFQLFLGGDSLEKRKPDPLPLKHAMETLGYTIAESLMIGDSKNDILAANSLSMDSIAVTYGYNYSEPIDNYDPTMTIDHFHTLLEYL